jgi:tetratricopeptide (TPR) repeat protein
MSHARELTVEDFRAFVEDYRNGNHSEAAQALRDSEPKTLSARSVEFLAGLDLDRPADRQRLFAGILLLTESALLLTSPDVRDAYLDEAVKLTTTLAEEEGIALQKELHLAASYRLFHQRRVMDALHVLEPAVARYPSDSSLQFGLGTLLELGGWLQSSPALLERARGAYEAILVLEPGDARAALRLGRVLCLLRRYEDAVPHLRSAVSAELSVPERVVGLLSLGDALRDAGSAEEGLGFYREALDLDPSSQAARVALSYTLRETGRLEEARGVLEPGFALATDIPGPDSFQRYLRADSDSHDERWRALRERLR